jgi:hypothetical protein
VKTSPEVERWFADRKYAQEPVMRRLREVILMSDPRIDEYLKYGTVIFGYEGDMVSFVGMNKKPFTLMFNRGARIPGRFPHLEGTHPSARFMRFQDVAEVDARAGELTRVVEAWCELVTPTAGSTKAGAKQAAAAKVKATTSTNARPKTSATKARAKRATGKAAGRKA